MTARLVGDRIVRNPEPVPITDLFEFVDEDGDTSYGVLDTCGDPIGVSENDAGIGVYLVGKDAGRDASWTLTPARARALARLLLARANEIEEV